MRDAAMMLQLFDRAGESPKDVQIGGLRRQHRGERGVSRLAIQSGSANACAGEEMSDWFHSVVRSVIES